MRNWVSADGDMDLSVALGWLGIGEVILFEMQISTVSVSKSTVLSRDLGSWADVMG
jgi:hypothetical protein